MSDMIINAITTAYPDQRICGAMALHRKLLDQNLEYAEARDKEETQAFNYARSRRAAERETVRIPVVVHVVYNAQEGNIEDTQIQSQLDVLNRDYRLGNPELEQFSPAWRELAADARIEFYLANTDPEGRATSGITRTATEVPEFGVEDEGVKSTRRGGIDPWPPDRYLNIWVCQLRGGLLGYAQFPAQFAAAPETDGVVIKHTAFGTIGTAEAPFNGGRTATHEIGHWLNLFHIWGDDGTGCSGTDFVDDTPNQAGPNFGRPAIPKVSCGNEPEGDMFVNFMDYTNDAVMGMFTAGQVLRMSATLDGTRSGLKSTATEQSSGAS